jgi:hypothetical protein
LVTCLEGSLDMDHEQRPPTPIDADVLAFIPDIDAPSVPAASTTSAGRPLGRLLSQAASAKLLLAAAAVLVVAAIVPFLFGKKDRPKPIADSAPVWQPGPVSPKADGTAKWTGGPTLRDANKEKATASNAVPITADLRGAAKPPVTGVQTPLFGDRVAPPASPNDERLHSIPPPRYPSTGAPPYAPLTEPRDTRYETRRPAPTDERSGDASPSRVGVNRPMAVADPATDVVPDYRPSDRRDYVPDYRREATTDYRREMPADYRQDTAADYPGGATPSLADRRMTPPPSGGQPTGAGQPGVARIEGIIDTPPVRTTHEFARPGVY